MQKVKFIWIIYVFIFIAIGYANQEKGSSSDIDVIVYEALEKFHVPGIAIGIVVDNEIALSKGYGIRDLEKGLEVTENTLFPIGSCTKAFTTFILGQLVEEGFASWDDLVIKYIPEFRLFNDQMTGVVTIRDLITHRTGLPRHDIIWFCKKMNRQSVMSTLQYLEPICGIGEKWYYNNLIYSVAGIIIERILGISWEEAIESRIFVPLKMAHSNVNIEQLHQEEDFSLPYAEIDGVIQKLPFHSLNGVEPGGAINSNLVDMLKWVRMHLTKDAALVSKDTLNEMHTPYISLCSKEWNALGIFPLGYGLGWFIGSYRGHQVVCHTGLIDGFSAEIILLPQQSMGMVFLSNSSTDGFYAIASIRNILIDRLLRISNENWIELAQANRAKAKTLLVNEENQTSKKPSRCLKDYVGVYQNPAYGRMEIYLDNDQLIASYGNMFIDLYYKQNATFKGQIRQHLIFGIKYITDFTFNSHADETHVTFEPNAKPILFKKIE